MTRTHFTSEALSTSGGHQCPWNVVSAALDSTLDAQSHFAILAVLHTRFFDSGVFRLGMWRGSRLETFQVILEPSMSFEQVRQLVQEIDCSDDGDPRCQCSVVQWIGNGDLPEELNRKSTLETVYQIDRQSKQLRIHSRGAGHDSRSAENWLAAYQTMHQRLCVNQQLDQPIGELTFISQDLQKKVLEFGCSTRLPSAYSDQPSTDFTFHRQFEKQVASAPDRIAVWAKESAEDASGIEWNYRTLNQQANAIAWYLIDAGIQVEDTVGIVMDRRVCLLAAMIGVMKAGGRYVGLEPELPADRLTFMMDDASVKFVITEQSHFQSAQQLADSAKVTPAAILNWDSAAFQQSLKEDLASKKLDQNPSVGVNSRNGAYLIYTSGSTGVPKGVDVWHHSFVDLCRTFIEVLELDQNDTGLGIATIAFDASICELFPPLLIGGKVGLGHKRSGANGTELSKLIREVSATYMFATPTSLRVLVASGWTESPDLTVIAGGEAVSSLVCREIGPRVKRLLNGYGPTETTVFATLGPLSPSQTDPVPIGVPIPNSRLYVLDDFGNLLPPMVPGNLFIGGQSLARGYLNRPELTAEKFCPDPFAESTDGVRRKMYASGDVAYWSHDGILHYIGRSDRQVKLRGYRIELGEIETRLCSHPAVKEAVAMVRQDTPGQQRLVAYVVYENRVSDTVLQDHLLIDMPEYMVPTWFVPLDVLPTSANLKLDHKALPNPDDLDLDAAEDVVAIEAASAQVNTDTLAGEIAAVWTEILNRKIRVDDQVFRMGADSLTAVKFQLLLQERIDLEIPIGEVFQYPSPRALAQQASRRSSPDNRRRKKVNTSAVTDIAVVGLAGRFPGAPNVDVFWDNLVNGLESIRDFTEEELVAAGVSPADYLDPNYVSRGTVLDDAYEFEPEFFGVTHKDAEVISPQIRLFMKTAWEALETAGYPVEPADHRIGVFAGCGNPNYLAADRHVPEAQRLQRLIGNGADFIATRTSYALGLTGPAIGIQTACSTSLVAVAHAVSAIRAGQCEMAIAGGSSCSWPMGEGYQHGQGLIYSADGHCRTFDHRASGTIFSQGSGAVLLRPLLDAINAGDTIHAVIKGVAVNNDGDRKGGYASPSIQGQSEVIQAALDDAEITADQISLMEAHGTGTKIGDPIEISGLKQAWQRDTEDRQFCAIGSVKANVGHADAAAGIVGLLKVIMSLKHKKIAPLVNFETANPEIDFPNSPFYINTQAVDWQSDQPTRVAAISAFGMGGTNAHLIVAEGQSDSAEAADDGEIQTLDSSVDGDGGLRLIPFSARTEDSLSKSLQDWTLSSNVFQQRLSDIAFTMQSGRKHFKRRACAVVEDNQQLSDAIANACTDDALLTEDGNSPQIVFGNAKAISRKVVFLFTGQGAQYANMARQLYDREPVFKAAIDQCDAELKIVADGLVGWLFSEKPACDVNQTQHAQVALFAVSYAQAKLWQSWGVTPAAMVGHSIGEYVAAAIAGVVSLKDAVGIVAKRGRLMQSMPAGSMLAVMHHDRDIQELLAQSDGLDLAVVNSRTVAVVAGPDDAVERFAKVLDGQGINSKKLHTSHAFHSTMMDPVLDQFIKSFDGVKLNAPLIPYLSNVSGTWITEEQSSDPNYYAKQIRSTVRFAENLETLMSDDEDYLFIELGPGTTLTQILKSQFAGGNHAAVATIPGPKQSEADSQRFAWEALGRCWVEGLDIDWDRIEPKTNDRRRRVLLPTYRFSEQTFRAKQEKVGVDVHRRQSESWYNVATWKQDHLSAHLVTPADQQGPPTTDNQIRTPNLWLLFSDGQHFTTDQLAEVLSADVVLVTAGASYSKISDKQYQIRADQFDDYVQLLQAVDAGTYLAGVVHAWTLASAPADQDPVAASDTSSFWDAQQRSTSSLAWLSKAIGETVVDHCVALNVLTRGVADLDPDVVSEPAHHCFVGGASVIQKEYRAIATKVIDVGDGLSLALANASKSDSLSRLLKSHYHEPLLAFDRGHWWKKDFDQIQLSPQTPAGIEDEAVIVITGGFGGLARNMAIGLAERYQNLKIVLLARTVLPPASQWDEILEDSSAPSAPTRSELQQRILDFRRLEALCEVAVIKCDVSDEKQLIEALSASGEQFGPIDLLLHTAGVLNDGIVASKTAQQLESVIAAKSLSADVCCRYVQRQPGAIKSVVFFSSIASDIGLFGQFAYSAANNYLDGLCQQMSDGPADVFSVNWPAFRDVGMAVRSQVDLSSDAALQREMAENSFTVAEGTQALIDIVSNRAHQRVALSKQPFSQRLAIAVQDGRSVGLPLANVLNDGGVETDDAVSVEDRMLSIWRQQFGNENLSLDEDYFELGGDSLMAVGMIAEIEKVFGKMVPISHLINSPTPRKLVQKLGLKPVESPLGVDGKSVGDELPAMIVQLKASTSQQPPLFLVHGADGAVMFYRDFASRLDTDSAIYGVESPFLSDVNHQISGSVEDMASAYLAAIRIVQPSGPYRIAGYSFGGVVAYEIARQLEADAAEVEFLVLYDIGNPALVTHSGALERLKTFWDQQETESTSTKLLNLTTRLGRAVKDRTTFEVEHRVARLTTAAGIDSTFWRHKKARELHMAMEESYVPQAVRCPVGVVAATGNSSKFRVDENMGWGDLAADLQVQEIEGSHLLLFEEPFVEGIIKATEIFLDQLDQRRAEA